MKQQIPEAVANFYKLGSDNICLLLEDLVKYYPENKNQKNLDRLMMLLLQIEAVSVKFYPNLKAGEQRLHCVEHCLIKSVGLT
ncbi:hypothetical protein [Laspinema olomoucense]|uniref:Uncharacterized protein n=1 Tax=Laspinema olomoucense D3b TaxID=2953688 RepID=A0ABT2N1T3_9CYAN|nr:MULTISPECIES: hypothetical protein [unclassified Laspinema]MCT7976411.1 hypothetical protein [Laspinema sp. D3b]MCT7991594.1 hypothetical protein [Laspinema sp. D3a]MCT7994604.1 hypothetical protein [Laspinema sp. D3c]